MGILTLVRHGQASFGAANYDELTRLGHAQAMQTGTHFAQRGLEFDRIISGPLQRQRQTVGAITCQLPVAGDTDIVGALKEFAEPSQILASAHRVPGLASTLAAELSPQERMQHYGQTIQAWCAGTIELEGAQSIDEFIGRVGDWFAHAVSGNRRARRTLAVTSAGVIAACMVTHFGLPASRLSEFAAVIRNCSVTEFIFSENRCSLLAFNNTTHLLEGLTSTI